jgi:hypothetical protein
MSNLPALILRGAKALVGEQERPQGDHADLEPMADRGTFVPRRAHRHEEAEISMSKGELSTLLSEVENRAAEKERKRADAEIQQERDRANDRVERAYERAADRSHGITFKILDSQEKKTENKSKRSGWGWRSSTYRGNGYWNYKTVLLLLIAAGIAALWIGRPEPRDHTIVVRDQFGQIVAVHHEWY